MFTVTGREDADTRRLTRVYRLRGSVPPRLVAARYAGLG